ncbi:MAG TPA: DUF3052 domain-containing protein [Actinomycetota bacterium]|nr:DUF3052 domain-containing protein [Actinomycetota bacterium]
MTQAAGYSGRSAAAKLGIKDGSRLALWHAPSGWELEGLPGSVDVRHDLRGSRDVTVAFVRSSAELKRAAKQLERGLDDTGSLWIAWPRKAGGHVSDVTEDLLREVMLPLGIVDVKVAAVDEDWSGLRFVRRKELRNT